MPAAVPRVYFTHPVLAYGTETEGGTPTFSADTATTVPVIVLNKVPSVGDYLTAYSVGGRWVSEETSGGSSGIPCSPCNIPAANLTIVVDEPAAGQRLGDHDVFGEPAEMGDGLLRRRLDVRTTLHRKQHRAPGNFLHERLVPDRDDVLLLEPASVAAQADAREPYVLAALADVYGQRNRLSGALQRREYVVRGDAMTLQRRVRKGEKIN